MNRRSGQSGFTLAEMLASLMIGAMVLTSVLTIYWRVHKASASVLRNIDSTRGGQEVLQKIAEDLDAIITANEDVKITLKNANDNGFASAQLQIVTSYYDAKNTSQTFKDVIWQTGFDYDQGWGLVLYRSYSGITPEDKLLDSKRALWEEDYTYIPMVRGVTYFNIEAVKGDELVSSWESDELPTALVVTLSFAEPFETVTGNLEVLDEDKIFRTIAIDRTRSISFKYVAADLNDFTDPNLGLDEEDLQADANNTELNLKTETESPEKLTDENEQE
jgi:prepilin-type N-terminal cleavage/methylation domain-containing protein